jgi:hypothetical protein
MDGQDSELQVSSESEPLLSSISPSPPEIQRSPAELRREQALQDFKKQLVLHRDWDAKLKDLRMGIRGLEKDFDKTEEDMKALQSVGQIVGEVLKQLDEEKFIVKASSGPRYVVGCRNKVNKAKLKQGARVGDNPFLVETLTCSPRYDYADHHANVASGSRSNGFQHESRGPWSGLLFRDWWIIGADQRTARGMTATLNV